MNKQKSFYITTTLPYVNSDPHIGFALELVQSDAIARYRRLLGQEVFFNTGTDEHGQKIFDASQKEGGNVEACVDKYANEFKKLAAALNISNDAFIRTTEARHILAAQEIWCRCEQAGDIYKKSYTGKYCVGCEVFKPEKDLDATGRCLLHPSLEITILEEENYFFRFSKYQEKLLEYLSRPGVIIPEWRREEAINFVKGGLEDFSISREKERLSWGVPVPGDETQVMYVWFDALTNYISTLGWPASARASTDAKALVDKSAGKPDLFQKFWTEGEVVQTAGKDQIRFQSLMWQAMLMSAGIKNTDKVAYHGFITSGGQKMSKSLGNVINPLELVKEYGADAVRYFLLRHVSPFDDSDVTLDGIKEAYNANLANGLGNLVSRIMTMAENNLESPVDIPEFNFHEKFVKYTESYNLQKSCEFIWLEIGLNDIAIQENQPFKLLKSNPEEAKEMIQVLVIRLYGISKYLEIFLPETSQKIQKLIRENKKPERPIFPRKD